MPRIVAKLIRSFVKRFVRYGPLREAGYTLSIYGVWLSDHWEDATFRFCANASYGFFYSDWIENLGDSVFIDIGANQGLYSLIAAKNPRISKVYAFEPQPEVFERLCKNISRNAAHRIQAFPFAVSDSAAERQMRVKEGHSGVATLRDESMSGEDFGHSVKIITVNKDFLNSEINVPEGTKIAIKIDTEGHEAEVLAELMRSGWWSQVFNIYYEVDERYIDHARILKALTDSGFSVAYRNGRKPHYDLMLQRSAA